MNAANPGGELLEPARGTGVWTQYLAQTAERGRAVDAAPEMIALNRARLERHPTATARVTRRVP